MQFYSDHSINFFFFLEEDDVLLLLVFFLALGIEAGSVFHHVESLSTKIQGTTTYCRNSIVYSCID